MILYNRFFIATFCLINLIVMCNGDAFASSTLTKSVEEMMKKTPNISYRASNIPSRAITYDAFGEPSTVLRIKQVPRPIPAHNQVLIKMKLCAINPSDLITIRGTYKDRISLPRVPGYEGVGYVVDRGEDVQTPQIGERVLALRGDGTWQDYTTVTASEAVVVPNDINDQTAAQLYINPLTAWVMLKEELKLSPGDAIAVNAAGSAFGNIMAIYSKVFGYNMIAIVRRDDYTKNLLQAGAKKVINTSRENLKEAIFKYTNGCGVVAALDAIGGDDGALLAECLQNKGVMLHYGLLSGRPLSDVVYTRQRERQAIVKPYYLRDWVYSHDVEYRQNVFKEMMDVFVQKSISLPVDQEYTLDQISEAVQAAGLSQRKGKILLKSAL